MLARGVSGLVATNHKVIQLVVKGNNVTFKSPFGTLKAPPLSCYLEWPNISPFSGAVLGVFTHNVTLGLAEVGRALTFTIDDVDILKNSDLALYIQEQTGPFRRFTTTLVKQERPQIDEKKDYPHVTADLNTLSKTIVVYFNARTVEEYEMCIPKKVKSMYVVAKDNPNLSISIDVSSDCTTIATNDTLTFVDNMFADMAGKFDNNRDCIATFTLDSGEITRRLFMGCEGKVILPFKKMNQNDMAIQLPKMIIDNNDCARISQVSFRGEREYLPWVAASFEREGGLVLCANCFEGTQNFFWNMEPNETMFVRLKINLAALYHEVVFPMISR